VPDNAWGRQVLHAVTGIASEAWSSLASPMQVVAAHVLADPTDITAHIEASRTLHGRIANVVHAELTAVGAECRPPQAGFYLYPDFGPRRAELAARGITTSAELATAPLEQHGIATLPGSAFGDQSSALTLRIATSLLYGTHTEQRLAALASHTPEMLPWIADALTDLHDGFTDQITS
jgi:aspartate aminotransferase